MPAVPVSHAGRCPPERLTDPHGASTDLSDRCALAGHHHDLRILRRHGALPAGNQCPGTVWGIRPGQPAGREIPVPGTRAGADGPAVRRSRGHLGDRRDRPDEGDQPDRGDGADGHRPGAAGRAAPLCGRRHFGPAADRHVQRDGDSGQCGVLDRRDRSRRRHLL